ncbi:type II toxin-antitoxin system HicA family toxin [soil metagenome]
MHNEVVPLKVREIKRLVEKAGWVYSHTTGIHAHYHHPTLPGIVTIPGAGHKELPRGTEANIKKQAGL